MRSLSFHRCRNIVIYDWRSCDIIYNNYYNNMQISWQNFDSDSLLWLICGSCFTKGNNCGCSWNDFFAVAKHIRIETIDDTRMELLVLCACCKGNRNWNMCNAPFPFFRFPLKTSRSTIWSRQNLIQTRIFWKNGNSFVNVKQARTRMRKSMRNISRASSFSLHRAQRIFLHKRYCALFSQSFIKRSAVQGTLDSC